MNFIKKFLIIFMILILFLSYFSFVYAADPKLISTIKKAFEKIQGWIITISTPAAAVAVRNWSLYEEIQFW